MFDEVDAYCSLHVEADVPSSNLLAQEIASIFNTRADGDYVETPQVNFAVVENDEFDEAKRKNEKNGFIFYRYKLEIEPALNLGEENAVAIVSKILEHFWSRGFPAAAACSYEDKLPRKGKYVSEQHQWR